MRWRWLASGPADGAEQMAVDEALLRRAGQTGEATFRVYAWSRPTLSFGRNEAARDRFDRRVLAARGYGAVRRPTGGRVLLHDGDVTYSVTAPADPAEPPRAAFARINALLVDAMRRLGVPVTAADGPRVRPGSGACFAEPSPGELVVGVRKLVASAQRRESTALLQHGSILLVDRQAALIELANGRLPPPQPAATLEGALGRTVAAAEVHDALHAAVGAVAGAPDPLDPGEVASLAHAEIARFAGDEWTWRR